MIDSRQITNDLISYITAQAPSREPIAAHSSLLEAEVFDSLLMMDLLAHLEATYGVRLEDADISPRHFRTVDCLVRLILSRLLSPLPADCLLCRELDSLSSALADLDAPSRLCSAFDESANKLAP